MDNEFREPVPENLVDDLTRAVEFTTKMITHRSDQLAPTDQEIAILNNIRDNPQRINRLGFVQLVERHNVPLFMLVPSPLRNYLLPSPTQPSEEMELEMPVQTTGPMPFIMPTLGLNPQMGMQEQRELSRRQMRRTLMANMMQRQFRDQARHRDLQK